jgi:ubiquinone/menaquinone biosynthesis C-methylase UbiE
MASQKGDQAGMKESMEKMFNNKEFTKMVSACQIKIYHLQIAATPWILRVADLCTALKC